MEFDKDLLSIQYTRQLVKKAYEAQKEYALFSQETVDNLLEKIVKKLLFHNDELSALAVEETGFGIAEDKKIKNFFAAQTVLDSMKTIKTRGILNTDDENGIWEIGVPVGIIAGLIPSTNPTSTVIYKTLISLKSGNGIVFSPHPSAINCITRTVDIIKEVLAENGISQDLVSVLPIPTKEATDELMKHDLISFILATGGKQMVKAAYSSGTPAWGVGPGNVPAFIEKSADIKSAVKHIIQSKTFDNGVICASEQAIVCQNAIKEEVIAELKNNNCYFVNDEEKKKMERIIARFDGSLNPKIVGKSAFEIASMAGFPVPNDTKIIVAFETKVGSKYPLSIEKLSPILAFYTADTWENACHTCIELLEFGGIGHSLSIHTENMDILREFALKKPVSRILVNTSSTHGGIGATTSLTPALTLGCGAVGGSATAENVGPLQLLNIRKVAFGVREYENIKKSVLGSVKEDKSQLLTKEEPKENEISSDIIEDIVLKVLESLQKQ